MTNFEKWKQTLKPEDLINEDNAVFECDGGLCPARDFCYALGEKMENCGKAFIMWAETESSEQ